MEDIGVINTCSEYVVRAVIALLRVVDVVSLVIAMVVGIGRHGELNIDADLTCKHFDQDSNDKIINLINLNRGYIIGIEICKKNSKCQRTD